MKTRSAQAEREEEEAGTPGIAVKRMAQWESSWRRHRAWKEEASIHFGGRKGSGLARSGRSLRGEGCGRLRNCRTELPHDEGKACDAAARSTKRRGNQPRPKSFDMTEFEFAASEVLRAGDLQETRTSNFQLIASLPANSRWLREMSHLPPRAS